MPPKRKKSKTAVRKERIVSPVSHHKVIPNNLVPTSNMPPKRKKSKTAVRKERIVSPVHHKVIPDNLVPTSNGQSKIKVCNTRTKKKAAVSAASARQGSPCSSSKPSKPSTCLRAVIPPVKIGTALSNHKEIKCIFCDFVTYNIDHLEKHKTTNHHQPMTRSITNQIVEIFSAAAQKEDVQFCQVNLCEGIDKSSVKGSHISHIAKKANVVNNEREQIKSRFTLLTHSRPRLPRLPNTQKGQDLDPSRRQQGDYLGNFDINMINTQSRHPTNMIPEQSRHPTNIIPEQSRHPTTDHNKSDVLLGDSDSKVVNRTMHCMTCSFSSTSPNILNDHTSIKHPYAAAAAAEYNHIGERTSYQSITFFCIRKNCSTNNLDYSQYQRHLLDCCACHKSLTVPEKQRLMSTLILIFEIQKKHGLVHSDGFVDFAASHLGISLQGKHNSFLPSSSGPRVGQPSDADSSADYNQNSSGNRISPEPRVRQLSDDCSKADYNENSSGNQISSGTRVGQLSDADSKADYNENSPLCHNQPAGCNISNTEVRQVIQDVPNSYNQSPVDNIATTHVSQHRQQQPNTVTTAMLRQQQPNAVTTAMLRQQQPNAVTTAMLRQQQPNIVTTAMLRQQQPNIVTTAMLRQQQPNTVTTAMLRQQQPNAVTTAMLRQQQPNIVTTAMLRQQQPNTVTTAMLRQQQPNIVTTAILRQQQPYIVTTVNSRCQQLNIVPTARLQQQQAGNGTKANLGQQPGTVQIPVMPCSSNRFFLGNLSNIRISQQGPGFVTSAGVRQQQSHVVTTANSRAQQLNIVESLNKTHSLLQPTVSERSVSQAVYTHQQSGFVASNLKQQQVTTTTVSNDKQLSDTQSFVDNTSSCLEAQTNYTPQPQQPIIVTTATLSKDKPLNHNQLFMASCSEASSIKSDVGRSCIQHFKDKLSFPSPVQRSHHTNVRGRLNPDSASHKSVNGRFLLHHSSPGKSFVPQITSLSPNGPALNDLPISETTSVQKMVSPHHNMHNTTSNSIVVGSLSSGPFLLPRKSSYSAQIVRSLSPRIQSKSLNLLNKTPTLLNTEKKPRETASQSFLTHENNMSVDMESSCREMHKDIPACSSNQVFNEPKGTSSLGDRNDCFIIKKPNQGKKRGRPRKWLPYEAEEGRETISSSCGVRRSMRCAPAIKYIQVDSDESDATVLNSDGSVLDSDYNTTDYGSDTDCGQTDRRRKRARRTVLTDNHSTCNFSFKGHYRCWLCEKVFYTAISTKMHIMLKHNASLCAINLDESIKTSSLILVLFCPRDCNFTTTKLESIINHMRICKKRFVQLNGKEFFKPTRHFLMDTYNKLQNMDWKAWLAMAETQQKDTTPGKTSDAVCFQKLSAETQLKDTTSDAVLQRGSAVTQLKDTTSDAVLQRGSAETQLKDTTSDTIHRQRGSAETQLKDTTSDAVLQRGSAETQLKDTTSDTVHRRRGSSETQLKDTTSDAVLQRGSAETQLKDTKSNVVRLQRGSAQNKERLYIPGATQENSSSTAVVQTPAKCHVTSSKKVMAKTPPTCHKERLRCPSSGNNFQIPKQYSTKHSAPKPSSRITKSAANSCEQKTKLPNENPQSQIGSRRTLVPSRRSYSHHTATPPLGTSQSVLFIDETMCTNQESDIICLE